DNKIQEYSEMSISSIFEKFGENYFRTIEHKTFIEVLSYRNYSSDRWNYR
ncbi:hypothetical protein EOM81_09325, partial [bacterium]|nr:hypothetical protein [bacterium]